MLNYFQCNGAQYLERMGIQGERLLARGPGLNLGVPGGCRETSSPSYDLAQEGPPLIATDVRVCTEHLLGVCSWNFGRALQGWVSC